MNLSLFLTSVRLICGPSLFTLFIWLVPTYRLLIVSWIVLMGLTDFLDGKLARRYGLETDIGKLIDPIADKLFIVTGFIIATALQHIHFVWAVLFVGREIVVMGVRRCALWYDIDVPVHWIAKWKTTAQFVLLTLLYGWPEQTILMHTVLIGALSISILSAGMYVYSVYQKVHIYEI